MEHIDFHISYRCPNKCIFCSAAGPIKRFKAHPLRIADIFAVLAEKRRQGFGSVNFTGGEPTLISSFPSLVKKTKSLGYRIYVGTNGGRFIEKDFCAETAPFLDEVCFSAHGHTAGLHNSLTKNNKSFERLQRAMDNLSKFATVYFSSNTVITKYNFGSLEKILGFLIKKSVKRALFSNLAPEGRGLEDYDRLAVRLNDLKNSIPRLVKISDKAGIIIKFFGLPACVLNGSACYSNDFCWDARLNIEQDRDKRFYLRAEACHFPDRGRSKTKRCRDCFYTGVCGGIFEEYLRRFGDGELRPFKR